MKRIVSYTASGKEEGKTISAWLKELGFSAGQIGRMKFRKDGICLNGERARVNRTLKEGDLLSLQLMDRGEDIREGTDTAPAPGKVVWADRRWGPLRSSMRTWTSWPSTRGRAWSAIRLPATMRIPWPTPRPSI